MDCLVPEPSKLAISISNTTTTETNARFVSWYWWFGYRNNQIPQLQPLHQTQPYYKLACYSACKNVFFFHRMWCTMVCLLKSSYRIYSHLEVIYLLSVAHYSHDFGGYLVATFLRITTRLHTVGLTNIYNPFTHFIKQLAAYFLTCKFYHI